MLHRCVIPTGAVFQAEGGISQRFMLQGDPSRG